jgi:hypothetical protein
MTWKFVWFGKGSRKYALRFALLNLWNALRGYELTIEYHVEDDLNMVSPAA